MKSIVVSIKQQDIYDWYKSIDCNYLKFLRDNHSELYSALSKCNNIYNFLSGYVYEDKLNSVLNIITSCLRKNIILYCEDINEEFVSIQLSDYGLPVPRKFVFTQPKKYVNNITLSQVRKEGLSEYTKDITPYGAIMENYTINDVKQSVEKRQQEVKELEAQYEETRKTLQAEMDKKLQEMRENMNKALGELQSKKEELENQVFSLEHVIYRLRCLLGDSVNIKVLREGRHSTEDTPLVIYQKLHYLDEDFAKFSLLHSVKWDEEQFVEDILSTNDDVFNMFCPSNKCVSLFKISKDSKHFVSNNFNGLDIYRVVHGPTVAILIRDGENLVCVWTEKEHINLSEDFFVSDSSKECSIDTQKTLNEIKKDSSFQQYLSRMYLLDVLEGLRQFTPYLHLQNPIIGNKDVVWSSADGWLEDTSMPTIEKFVKEQDTKVGDTVYVWGRLMGLVKYNDSWGMTEDRSRGNNLGNDANIEPGIHKINLVESVNYVDDTTLDMEDNPELVTKVVGMLINKINTCKCEELSNVSIRDGEYLYYTHVYKAGRGYVWKDIVDNGNYVYNNRTSYISKTRVGRKRIVPMDEPKYYISCNKLYSDKGARANLRVFKDEFINLTYVTSNLIEYWINTKNIGYVYGNINFAGVLHHLNKILPYIKDREQQDLSVLGVLLKKDVGYCRTNYLSTLNEWKRNKGVRIFNEYQAKRFLKEINND